jgi:type IV pilus assembly protein PilZ
MSDATTTPASGAAAAGAGRPSVISLAIREKAALYAAYMPFVQGGALFVPTTRPAQLGDDLYLILTLVDDPNKYAVPGKVVWITPAGSTGRQQGVGIQFARNESGEQLRRRIEELIGGALKSSRPTHTV